MKLSIVTINYNNAEGLRKTLASVASQTYADIEHIIVDGGSTDGSVEVIREYEQALASRLSPLASNLKWVSEPDKGIYNAMNKGIEIALGKRVVNSLNRSELVEDKNKGIEVALGKRVVNDDHTSSPLASRLSPFASDYIQILNSGDILAAPDVTERMMAALAQQVKGKDDSKAATNASRLSPLASSPIQNRPAIFYGNMIKEWPDGRRVNYKCLGDNKSAKKVIGLRKVEWTMYDFIHGTINHDPTYIRRDIYEKYGLYDDSLKIVSDWKWFVQSVVIGGEDVYYIPMDVTIFDMTGISETNLKYREEERREELDKMFPKAIMSDYYNYHFPIDQYKRLKKHKVWNLVYFVERVLFKLEKWGILK